MGNWLARARWSRLPHVEFVARMASEHFCGILDAVVLGLADGVADSVDAKLQRVKRMACGFCLRVHSRNAIYFYFDGLDLMSSAHIQPGIPTRIWFGLSSSVALAHAGCDDLNPSPPTPSSSMLLARRSRVHQRAPAFVESSRLIKSRTPGARFISIASIRRIITAAKAIELRTTQEA
ncbi:transposase [Engelhardtia mirabilis]|uniref:transposase n=1 Tax=Engelhardtia mirabilis TaxID=2528011 RepID=UPI0011A57500